MGGFSIEPSRRHEQVVAVAPFHDTLRQPNPSLNTGSFASGLFMANGLSLKHTRLWMNVAGVEWHLEAGIALLGL